MKRMANADPVLRPRLGRGPAAVVWKHARCRPGRIKINANRTRLVRNRLGHVEPNAIKGWSPLSLIPPFSLWRIISADEHCTDTYIHACRQTHTHTHTHTLVCIEPEPIPNSISVLNRPAAVPVNIRLSSVKYSILQTLFYKLIAVHQQPKELFSIYVRNTYLLFQVFTWPPHRTNRAKNQSYKKKSFS